MTQAYTSTVVAPVQCAAAVGLGAVLVAIAAVTGPWWLAVAICALMLATGVQLSIVRCAVGPERIVAGAGLWGRGQIIATSAVAEAGATDLGWPQVFGLGVRTSRRTTRLTIRPGPTLCLVLHDGTTVRISTDDPAGALHVLDSAATTQKETS